MPTYIYYNFSCNFSSNFEKIFEKNKKRMVGKCRPFNIAMPYFSGTIRP